MNPEREGEIPEEARPFSVPVEESLQNRQDFDGLAFRLEQQIGHLNPPESEDEFDRQVKIELLGLLSSLTSSPVEERATILEQVDRKLRMIEPDDEIDRDAKNEALSLVRQLRDSIA